MFGSDFCVVACRQHPQSEAEHTSRAHRQLDRGVGTSQGGSPHLTPRSTHAAPSDDDEEEEERPQARRKKIGDEPPSRQRSAPEQDESQGNSQLAILLLFSSEMNVGSVLTDTLCL